MSDVTFTGPPKSIFRSKTFWGAVLTLVVAAAPSLAKEVSNYQTTGHFDPNSIAEIAIVLATTGLTIIGRIDAGQPVYTPNGLPGPNKPEA